MLINRAALVMADLLQPETRHRRIEQPQQAKMLVLARIGGQLDDRCGTVEHLATTVEDEVVVGGDVGEGDPQSCSVTLREKHRMLKPLQATIFNIIAEVFALFQQPTISPKVPNEMNGEMGQDLSRSQVIRENRLNISTDGEIAH